MEDLPDLSHLTESARERILAEIQGGRDRVAEIASALPPPAETPNVVGQPLESPSIQTYVIGNQVVDPNAQPDTPAQPELPLQVESEPKPLLTASVDDLAALLPQ